MRVLSLIFFYTLATGNFVQLAMVRVNEGLLLGVRKKLSTGLGEYYSFKGIPYAEAPVGDLRFKDPIPIKPWRGVKEAIIHGSLCPQFSRVVNMYVPGSEDCLYLKVYTPDLKPEKPLTVMFYIYGGGFVSGSGNSYVYGPDFIVEKNVVLVTINYRVDALGFLNLDTKDVPGSAGMKDQSLALKWVHDNIHKFGGDLDKVTIFGESAGSASVTYHLLSPMSKGLFKRAIAMSGVTFCEWAISYETAKRSFALGNMLGSNTTDPNEMLEFLQRRPILKLIHKFPTVMPVEENWAIGLKMSPYVPAPEKNFGQKRFLVESATESLKKGKINSVDLMIGYTSLEYLYQLRRLGNSLERYNNMRELLIPREITYYGRKNIDKNALAAKISEQYFGKRDINNETVKEFLDYQSEEIFVYNINRFLRHLPNGNKKFLYKFFCISEINKFTPDGELYGITGVGHTDDLRYVFDIQLGRNQTVDVSSEAYRLINQTVTLFTNFAKYG
ncbi:juvenile hormone esterase-like isoform X2 [Ostrinia nubilalis]|uniref:juvenile hormone esterase-like isoform X2 n=1 Tax=Ostrinia nubilalis TaxID=29057 RepID=UPI0030823F49